MTNRYPKEGPPAGHQQALGPPPPSGMPPNVPQAPGVSSSVSENSKAIAVGGVFGANKYGHQEDVSASMIGGDRSRCDEAQKIEVAEPQTVWRNEEEVVLAGPMRDWDPLYMLLILLSLCTCICAVCAMFLPFSFAVSRPRTPSWGKEFSLFDSKPCGSFSDDVSNDADEQAKEEVCYGSDGKLGNWVLATQILGIAGLGLGFITLVLQLVNMCSSPRSRLLHSSSLYAMAGAGLVLMLAGHLGHNRSVWSDVLGSGKDAIVQVEPLGSGLFLISSVLSGWSCVITHVTSHGPGPLSMNSHFLHTFREELVVAPSPALLGMQQPAILEEPLTVSVQMEGGRRESAISTAV